MNVGPTANKKNVLEQLLEQGMVLVALDARVEGVDVPTHLGKDPQLRLNVSYRFGLPMTIDEWGVCATLTFAGIPYNCRFPWNSIFLLVSHVSGQPYLFPDDIPAELLAQAPEMAHEAKTEALPGKVMASRPKLTLVVAASESDSTKKSEKAAAQHSTAIEQTDPPQAAPGDSSANPPDPDENSPRPRRSRRRGHLRLVK